MQQLLFTETVERVKQSVYIDVGQIEHNMT